MLSLLLAFSASALLAADPPAPGDMVRIGTRNVHIHCTGAGETTVLLVSGIPRFSFHFALVQPEVSKFTRVCAYDKGGEAWTDPLPALNAGEMLRELDGVVQHVAPNRPVVLAGHSFGGILARAYYRMRPEKVRGLLVIDSPHPDMIVMPVNGQPKRMYELTEPEMQTLAEVGRKRNAGTPPEPKIQPPFDRLPPGLQPVHLWAMKKAIEASRGIDPLLVLKTQAEFSKRLRDQRFEIPVIVVTRAKSAEDADAWVSSQQRLAEMAVKGKLVRAVGSGHDIQLEQPALIVDSIRELLAQSTSPANRRP